MKRLALALIAVLALAGCGDGGPPPTITEMHYYPARSQTVLVGQCAFGPDGKPVTASGTCTANTTSWPERFEICKVGQCMYISRDFHQGTRVGDEYYGGFDTHPSPSGGGPQ